MDWRIFKTAQIGCPNHQNSIMMGDSHAAEITYDIVRELGSDDSLSNFSVRNSETQVHIPFTVGH